MDTYRELPPIRDDLPMDRRLVLMLKRLSTVSKWTLRADFGDDELDALEEAIADADKLLEEAGAA